MKNQSIWRRFADRITGEARRAEFAELSEDESFIPRSGSDPRISSACWGVAEDYAETLRVWRENPLARRIVSLTTQYIVGRGIQFHCADMETNRFLDRFWNHPLNQLDQRIPEWLDELTRSGNLFLRLTTDASGMTYLRALPASSVARITTAPLDAETTLEFEIRSASGIFNDPAGYRTERIPVADRLQPALEDAIFHVAINRPIGTAWGSSDLAPVLKWLRRYSSWLEDRARLNRYRNSFLFVVKSRLSSESQRVQRQKALNMRPPTPGSILVTTENEEWAVLTPKLESHEAGEDGIALKKMIAVGAGVPLHFLAEPESENKASAEASGGSAYRGFEQRQQFFLAQMRELLLLVVGRAAIVDRRLDPNVEIRLIGSDINAGDNLRASQSALNAVQVMRALKDENAVDRDELLRVVYRFLGES